MRPSHSYSHTSSVHSRPDSRASSNGTSPAASPTRAKVEKIRADVASGKMGKKASLQKKLAAQQHQHQQQDFSDSSADFAKVKAQQHTAAKVSQTPGLITLTKPLSQESDAQSGANAKSKKNRSRQQRSSSPSSDATKSSKTSKKNAKPNGGNSNQFLALDDHDDGSVNLLSKSAPSTTSTSGAKHNRKGGHAHQAVLMAAEGPSASSDGSGALTWQQELLKASSAKKPGNKRNSAHTPAKGDRNGSFVQPLASSETSSLTWQQELFNSKKRVGPHFDVFADARDAETFGGSKSNSNAAAGVSEGKGRRRARAGSVGSRTPKGKSNAGDVPLLIDDLFSHGNDSSASLGGSSHRRGQSSSVAFANGGHPSTPAKKAAQHPSVAAAIAYAGPNFHNSPSPASLPAPKFSSRLAASSNGNLPSSSLGTSSSSGSGSEDEYEAMRSVRGATAPAEFGTPISVSDSARATPEPAAKPAVQSGATVESLLARMMGGARLA